MARDNIRNFCIIAHIDHGKSTLSDRILELTKSVDERTMEDQILDNMDIERERGITIKARAVTMNYTAKDGKTYEFNLIDTPGHVDFAYEVSRSLAACEGAILVVDATQGVEAQTLANTYMALEHDLELVPILNKIDLPSAHPDEVAQEVEDVIGLPCLDAPRVSAKTGLNVDQVLERVVTDIPAPTGDPDAPLKALIFDSIYDSYKGVIVYIRVFEGTVKPGDTIRMMATGAEFTLVEVGHMGATNLTPCAQLQAGEVGYLTASIKTVQDTRVGDTVTLASRPTAEALPGYRQVKPMVFCGIYPADGARYPDLKDALEKLQLNDASLTFDLETSAALGFGFRCGFLGLLHMEIITERLEREFDLDIITTTPSVRYRLTLTDGTVEMIDNPSSYPDPSNIVKQEEPFVDVHLYTPNDYVGGLMDLCQNKRGALIDMKYLDDVRVDLHYAMPLGEIVYDFFDAIKSRSRGYASYDYEFKEYRESDLVNSHVRFTPGSDLFEMALQSQIFVDKSGLIEKTNRCVRKLQRYLCVSRPRRFGKSMAADMLAAYYDRSTDTDALFRNLKIGRSETYKKHRNQYDVIKINMQEFLSATSGIDEMLRMLNDYLIFDLREQYSQVRFRDEKNLVQVMKDLTYNNEKENASIPTREVSQEYINAISRFPFCNTTMKTRCGRIFLALFSVPACSV